MAWYNFNKKEESPSNEDKSFDGFRAINTEGLDLSKPFVDDYFNRGYSWVFFGENNLQPQIFNQLYVSSPMHQACCNFKKYSIIGDGYEWENYDNLNIEDKIKIKQFETMSDFRQSSKKIALDWIKHGRAIAIMRYSKEYKKYTHFRLVDPESIRNNVVTLFQDRPTKYFYSRDWTRSVSQLELSPYKMGCTDEWQLVEIRNNVGGFRSYGVPDWMSSANWQSVSADLGLLHKSAIENGIQPSIIWKFPYEMSPDERERWEHAMRQQGKGAKNYGRAVKVEAQGAENMPTLEVVKTTDNHKIFEQTSREQKEEIAISHNINPALMGVRIAGALGQSEEIEFSANQFEKIWINENREIIEDFMNQLASICGIETKIKINKTEVTSIVEGAEKSTANSNGELNTTENLESNVNDNLKGLSAKDNMDLMRIIRDFSKGRLAEALARTRLRAYGIDEQTINELMTTV